MCDCRLGVDDRACPDKLGDGLHSQTMYVRLQFETADRKTTSNTSRV